MVIVPTGDNGDIITISGLAYNRGGPSNNNPAGDLLRIVIDNNLTDTPFTIAAGNVVLGSGGVDDLKGLPRIKLRCPSSGGSLQCNGLFRSHHSAECSGCRTDSHR